MLAAEQETWVTCRHCSRRSAVPVPNWSARTKAVELLLEQGFGRPEVAPKDEDEQLQAVIAEALTHASDEELLEVADLADFQRRFLSRPMIEQAALSEADEDEVFAIAERHGYQLSPA